MVKVTLTGITREALKVLPKVLDDAGYAGKYEVNEDFLSLRISTTASKAKKFLMEAENQAHKEPGRLITIRKTAYSQIWIPETEAADQMHAYLAAFEHAENGWPVENDETFEVTGIEDNWYWDKNSIETRVRRS